MYVLTHKHYSVYAPSSMSCISVFYSILCSHLMHSCDLFPDFYAECHMLYYKEFISLLVTQVDTKLHISSCILCSGLKKQKKKKSVREQQVLFVMLVKSD